MISYLIKLFVLIVFSALIIFFYYSNWAHIENFNWYLPYVISMWIIYWVYKFFQLQSLEKKVSFTPIKILWYFCVHWLLLSVLYFSYNWSAFWVAFWDWITLFFKILFYSIIPLIIFIISLAFWKKILWLALDNYQKKSENYKFITGVWFWFFSFVFLLTILWMLWAYNIISVGIILIVFIILSYKNLLSVLFWIFTYRIKCTKHNIYSKDFLEQLNPKLLSTEFFFIVITLILSINLISVFRPFPIGWDDLWAYMNYPHLMANAWVIWELWSMMSWQTFTWIGYMFNNPTLAFFLNNVWGFLSVIVIVLIISEIFKNKKSTFVHLPLLAATLFISMPMVIFQQAKDMKLDPGLFFISIIALYMLFEFYTNYKKNKEEKKLLSKKWLLKLFLIIGLLLWFTFTIKFTSLLLISAVLWILFYTRLWILGFLWYLSLYFAIFTAGWLWKMMNVVALDTPEVKTNFSIIAVIIWIAFLITARVKTKKRFRKFIPRIWALFVWILIAIAPWWISNIISTIDSWNKIWISALISWHAERFTTDYSKIYSKIELETIEKSEWIQWLNSSGTTNNEDFWRYFGYEKGINNYVKLPWNLTMQSNQGWEFTTIWFLFLALLPTVFLFLPFRRKEYALWIYGLILFEVLLFVIPVSRDFFTNIMTSISLPYWYIFILLLALVPLIFFIPTLQKNELTKLFKINLIFAIFYSFLWGISAFWIVWYWIVMYFNFILMIVFWAYYLGSYSADDTSKKRELRFFGTLVFFSIIAMYLFMSVFPHSFNNLKSAWYKDYKTWNTTVAEAPYLFHPEYLAILYNLNIDPNKSDIFLKDSIISDKIKKIIQNNKLQNNIVWIRQLLMQILKDKNIKDIVLKKSAQTSLQNIYKNISKPKPEYKNTAWIYRIGTFLKYHISENNKRLLEDSLVTIFDTYIYDTDVNIWVDRMKKLWINYLLVDLNAATIDKDPRHNLTKRYEKLLTTFTSNKLDLIETDSVCLKVALEEYKKNKNLKTYLDLAGVNYDGYTSNNKKIKRSLKQVACYEQILSLIESKQVTQNSYSYLNIYIPHLAKLKNTQEKVMFLHKYVWHGFKVLFKIK